MTDQDAARSDAARSDPPLAAGTTAAPPIGLRALLARPWAPVLLALGLALLSSPVVAWSLTLPPEAWEIEKGGWVPVDGASAMLLALAAVIPAALVGGSLGGSVRLRWPALAAFVVVWISWAIAIVVLPAAATLLGVTLRIAIFCFDACNAELRDGEVASGIDAYGAGLLAGAVFVVPAFAIGVLAFAAASTRRAFIAGVVLAVLAHGVVHFWSLWLGGLAAWLCLAVGVVIWSAVLPRPAIRPAAAEATPPWTASGRGPSAEHGPPAAPATAPPVGQNPTAPSAGQPPVPLA